jgi:serine phosphatase RsbU (regulator of sigma subunit)
MSLTITKITSEKLTISSAAMPPLYLFRSATGKVEEMLVPNLPLGGLESENYESFDVAFNVDDVLVMISDGLAELPNKNGELLEYGRISSCILENAEKRSKQIKAALVRLADQWSDGLSNPDDITVLVIKKNSIL